MGPLTTHSADHPSPTDQAAGDSPGLQIRPPSLADGAAMWRIARDSQVLDVNTSYAYLLMARDFGAHSAVAEVGGEVVGYCMSYLRPQDPDTVFVWQIAVDASQRGRGLAGRLLDAVVDATGALLENSPAICR